VREQCRTTDYSSQVLEMRVFRQICEAVAWKCNRPHGLITCQDDDNDDDDELLHYPEIDC